MTEDHGHGLRELTFDQQIDAMNKIRHQMDAIGIEYPLDREAIIIFLTTNYIVTTNELFLKGERDTALMIADRMHKNIRDLVNHAIDGGGMRVDGIDSGSIQ